MSKRTKNPTAGLIGRGSGLVVLSVVLAVACLLALPLVSVRLAAPASAVSYSSMEVEFVGLINQYRQQNGLSPLLASDKASDAAEKHSSDMATHDFFSHDTVQSDWFSPGTTFSQRLNQCGYTGWTWAGENIAAGQTSAASVFNVWKSSSEHNANMLSSSYRVIGIGLVVNNSSSYGYYWTTDFGDKVDSTAHDITGGGATTTTARTTTTTRPPTTTTTRATTTTTRRTTTTTKPPLPMFRDVTPGHTYYRAISELGGAGIITGYQVTGGLEFRPENPVWRAQFAKMIVGALELPVSEDLASPFTDLGSDAADSLYPHEFVAVVYRAGITAGLTSTTFGPWEDITRAQVVTMIVRAARNLRPGLLDAPPTAYRGTLGAFSATHAESMRWAEYNGLLQPLQAFGAGWDPWAMATRGEVAELLAGLRAD